VAGRVALAARILARAGLEDVAGLDLDVAGLEAVKAAPRGQAHVGEGHDGWGEEEQGEAHADWGILLGLES